ncbi:sigma factor [Methylobacterium mesophilicum]|uniref:sigma factor n=1 Tax=Methylobacterium mesophilicum TaxID=39956 RepID=UPI002F308715
MPYHPDPRSRAGFTENGRTRGLKADRCPDASSVPTDLAGTDLRSRRAPDHCSEAEQGPALESDQFQAAVLRLLPDLRQIAGSMTTTARGAEDLVQETLIRIWLDQDRFRPSVDLRAWAFTIMRSSCSSHRGETSDAIGIGVASSVRNRIDPEPSEDDGS